MLRITKTNYNEAMRISGNRKEIAVQILLADALYSLPAQTFDVNVHLDDSKPIELRVGGSDPRYCDPVSVAVEEP